MMLAGRQRDVQRESQMPGELYSVDCMSATGAFTCAILCNNADRIRSIFVWCIDSLAGNRGLHSLETLPRMVSHSTIEEHLHSHHDHIGMEQVQVPIGHAKYTAMACHQLDTARGGDMLVAGSSRKLLELWQLRLSGDVSFYTCIELAEAPQYILFSSCASVLCCIEGRSGVALRAAHTLEVVAHMKRPADQATGIALASRGDVTALGKSLGENVRQSDDTIAVCYESGKVMAWGIHDLLKECRRNVASNYIVDCTASPTLLLECNLACRQAPCGIACVSRSLTVLGASSLLTAGQKKSSFLATESSLFLINVAAQIASDIGNGELLPYACREVRCLDLERELRFQRSPRRDRDHGRPAGRNRSTPVKTRPTVSGSNGGVNFNSAPTPAAISQKISAGAVLSLSLCCAVPVEAAMGVVSSAVVLTQTSVLLVNMQHFRLDQAISMDSLGLGTLAFATSPALGRDSGGNLWPLTLLPAFGHSKMPYVFMCGVEQDTKPAVVDRHSPSPTKPVTIRSKAQDQEQNGGSNIFAGRPPPSWALSAAEKNGKGPLSSAEDTPITVPVQPSPMVGIAEVGEAPQFSFFTSTQRRSSQEDMVDDLRIGLPTNSPLLAVYRPPPTPEMHQGAARTSTKGRASGTSWETPKVDKTSGKVRDMPVTFHDRVKSSGYGQNKPKQLSFAAKAKARPMLSTKGTGADVYNDRTTVAQPSLRSVSAPRHGKKSNAVPVGRLIRSYPTDCQPTLAHMPQNDFPCGDSRVERGAGERRAVGPLHGVRFSEDGTWAGLVSQDSAVETLKTPVGKHAGAGLVYCGHDAGLTSICFSHCNGLMLSASKDGTARLWRIGRVEAPGVIFSHRLSHPRIGAPGKLGIVSGSSSVSTVSARNKPYGGEMVAAQFFHLDKFVMLATKSSVYMYSYEPEGTDALNDIKRLQSYGKYKLVMEYPHPDTHRVSALACMNSVQSVLCLSATADRKLHLLDASIGSVVRTVDVAHDKAIHCIALPQPSVHCRVDDPHAYNMFATASTDNSILLWDIRTPNSVCRYGSHVNRREAVNCCLSPCMRYLATGSEDRTARIVDLRTGMKELGKTGSGLFKDVVTGVTYHPLHAQLAVCSFDGTVKFFNEGDYSNPVAVPPTSGGYI